MKKRLKFLIKENMNVIACLMEIRRNPVNNKGEKQHLLHGI